MNLDTALTVVLEKKTPPNFKTCQCGQVMLNTDDSELCGACLIDEWSDYDDETGEPCDFCHVCDDAADCEPIRYIYILTERTGTVVQGQACSSCREFIATQPDIEVTNV